MQEDQKTGWYQIEKWEQEGAENPEIMRLRKQMAFTLKKELVLWELSGLNDGMSILEVGSGPGWVTKELLRNYPTAHITAVEMNTMMNDYFKKLMTTEELQRVTLVEKSITESGLGDNLFDYALVRAVLQHVPEVDKAISEIFRVLKPGGVIYILDADHGIQPLIDPEMPKGKALGAKITVAHQMSGHPNISRHLIRKLRSQGFVDVDFNGLALHSDMFGFEMMAEQNNVESYKPMIDGGIASLEEVTEVIEEGEKFMQNPDALFIAFGFVTTGRKPLKLN